MGNVFAKAGIAAVFLAGSIVAAQPSEAAGGAAPPPSQDWSWEGPFGSYDMAAAQRGLQVYLEVCASCHGLRLVAYRNLSALGYSEDEIKELAAEFEVEDGPDDEGEMFTRAAIPADRFVSPFPNDNAARFANNGALPPDLSLMVKARPNGANYLYALLTGYSEDVPDDIEVQEGMNYNTYFGGNQIAMAAPLYEDGVEYADGTPATISQMASDVTTFLAWASEPTLEERKQMGVTVMIFLFVFLGLLIAVKRRVWSKVEH